MCMILASSESAFHGNLYALTNTFPVMKQLGIKQGKVIVQYYFKFGSNIPAAAWGGGGGSVPTPPPPPSVFPE